MSQTLAAPRSPSPATAMLPLTELLDAELAPWWDGSTRVSILLK